MFAFSENRPRSKDDVEIKPYKCWNLEDFQYESSRCIEKGARCDWEQKMINWAWLMNAMLWMCQHHHEYLQHHRHQQWLYDSHDLLYVGTPQNYRIYNIFMIPLMIEMWGDAHSSMDRNFCALQVWWLFLRSDQPVVAVGECCSAQCVDMSMCESSAFLMAKHVDGVTLHLKIYARLAYLWLSSHSWWKWAHVFSQVP